MFDTFAMARHVAAVCVMTWVIPKASLTYTRFETRTLSVKPCPGVLRRRAITSHLPTWL